MTSNHNILNEGSNQLDTQSLKEKTVEALESKKAKDINVIDINNVSTLGDYFIICNGTSTTHIKSLSDEVETKLEELGIRPLHKEGYESARWILLDYGSIVVHIFHEEDRAFYNLERLWRDGIITSK